MLTSIKKVNIFKNLYAHFPSRARFGASVYYSFRRMIQETQDLPDEALKAYQFKQLKKIVQHAWDNIPGYRKHWENGNFEPGMLRSLDDLEKIPFITKEIIRDKLDDFSYKNLKGLQKVTTGGSTGVPFAFYQQRKNNLIELAFMHELWVNNYPEIDLKTKASILRGKRLGGPVGYDPLNGLILSSFDLTPQITETYVEAIEKYKTPILRGYPSSLYLFSSFLEKQGITMKHQFKSVMLGSEILYDFQYEKIKRVFNAPVINWYGHVEKAILAGFCKHSRKFHSYPQYGITEIIGQEDQEVKAGESGELIGTSFWNFATPFIRYRTMDYARKGAGSCPECNKHYQLIDEILGREHEYIVDKDKKLIALTGVSIVCGTFTEVDQFRFYQDTVGKFVFRYIKKTGVDEVNTDFMKNALFDKIGSDFEIAFEEVSQIDLTSSGKMMYLEQKLEIAKFMDQ